MPKGIIIMMMYLIGLVCLLVGGGIVIGCWVLVKKGKAKYVVTLATLLMIVSVSLTGCVTMLGGIKGYVRDAETKEVIKDAKLVGYWHKEVFGSPGGPVSMEMAMMMTRTNSEGCYKFPRKIRAFLPIGLVGFIRPCFIPWFYYASLRKARNDFVCFAPGYKYKIVRLKPYPLRERFGFGQKVDVKLEKIKHPDEWWECIAHGMGTDRFISSDYSTREDCLEIYDFCINELEKLRERYPAYIHIDRDAYTEFTETPEEFIDSLKRVKERCCGKKPAR
ncbi:MAG: hypothetical protein QME81_08725 [bacterium]|nr:hypothetical protein [bacterium]